MANAEASSSKHKEKRDKKDKKERKDKKDKKEHKHKHHHSSTKSATASNVDGPFEHRVQRMRLSVPPKFAADWLEGVRETLNGMLMQYVPAMGGVLLAHWEHEFVDDTVKIINECPFGVCEVQFHSIVWAPKVGQVLYGTHSLSSPSHLSLLFAKTFNVSIPLQHIPQDKYEFEHTDDVVEEHDELLSDDEVDNDLLAAPAVHEVGRWKEKGTGALLGAERVRFTVIGLQVTNQMLSLTGSLLDDPSNPPALPTVAVRQRSPSPDLPERPAKVPRKSAPAASTPAKTPAKASATAAAKPATPAVDESKLSARELKQLRKEQAREKRDARKARKEGAEEEGEGAEDEAAPAGTKRKAEDEGGERKKKRKD